jgi:hypothetical protein
MQTSPRSVVTWLPVVAFLILTAAVCERFFNWMPHGIAAGDDIYNFVHFMPGQWLDILKESFAGTYYNRYRPVFGLVWGVWRHLFGLEILGYILTLLVMHGLSATLLFMIAMRLCGKVLPSLALALLFACSRFAFYQVTMLTGIVEALPLLSFMVMLWSIAVMVQEPARALAMRVTAVAALLFTVAAHERYLPVVPWLSVVLWLTCGPDIKTSKKWAYALAPWLILVAHIAIKAALKANLMEGTGGAALSLDPARVVLHAKQALQSLFGVNRGPEYLVGLQSAGALRTLGIVFGVSFLSAVLLAVALAERKSWLIPLGLATLAALLLVPPMLTIRLEQRWLLAPSALMLLALAWALSRGKSIVLMSLIAVACSSLFVVDMALSRSSGQTFMGYGTALGNFAAMVIKDGSGGPPGTPLVIQTHPDGCVGFVNGLTFKLYEGVPRDLTCVLGLPEAQAIAAKKGAVLFVAESRIPWETFHRAQ